MGASLKLSWILVLVLILRPLLNEMKMVQAAEEERKLHQINRKMKELIPQCDEQECQIACDNDGYGRGRCFSDYCVCYETKKVEAEEAEKRQAELEAEKRHALNKDLPDVQQHAKKMDFEVKGQLN